MTQFEMRGSGAPPEGLWGNSVGDILLAWGPRRIDPGLGFWLIQDLPEHSGLA